MRKIRWILFIGTFCFSTDLLAQFSESFEGSVGDPAVLEAQCWTFDGVTIIGKAGYKSAFGAGCPSMTNHNPAAGTPSYFQIPSITFENGITNTLNFRYRVSAYVTTEIKVFLRETNGDSILISTLTPSVPWQLATIPFSYAGSCQIEFQFYTHPGTTPTSGTHRIYVDEIAVDLGILATCSNASFPVDFVDFKAKAVDKSVVLNWVTENEVNNDHFVVERSVDGQNFESVGTVFPDFSGSAQHRYDFTDHVFEWQKNYTYRIKQVDIDGAFTVSETVEVYVGGKTNGVFEFFDLMGNHVYTGYLDAFTQQADKYKVYIMRDFESARKIVIR